MILMCALSVTTVLVISCKEAGPKWGALPVTASLEQQTSPTHDTIWAVNATLSHPRPTETPPTPTATPTATPTTKTTPTITTTHDAYAATTTPVSTAQSPATTTVEMLTTTTTTYTLTTIMTLNKSCTSPRTCHVCSSRNALCPVNGTMAGTDPGEFMTCPCGTGCYSDVRYDDGNVVYRGCTQDFPLWEETSSKDPTCQEIRRHYLCFCQGDRCNTHDMTSYISGSDRETKRLYIGGL